MPRRQPKVIGEGKHLRLLDDRGWEFADRIRGTGVVAIIAVTDDNRLILTEQFRPAIRKRVIDLPAGLAGDVPGQSAEDFAIAAQRELIEETGYRAKTMSYLFTGPSSAGMVTEMISFYRATKLSKVTAGGGDESENIRVREVSLRSIHQWLFKRETARTCVDPKVFSALGILAGVE